jgi:hypothetical protein
LIRRVQRNTALSCLALALVAGLWSRDVRMVGGVLGGGVLVGFALWALAGAVGGGAERAMTADDGENHQEIRPVSRGGALVKFFTRHVILAFVAYVMMVRLHLDPIGMVVGVTSVVVAAILEAARPR